MWPNPCFSTDLVTFTEEIYKGKLHDLLFLSHINYPKEDPETDLNIKFEMEVLSTNWT